jgi:DNA-binding LytR/AlgR family response regulator
MNVVIIEDEKLAAEKLENTLHRIDENIHVMAKIGSVKEAVRWLSDNQPDLIFLDIHLSDGLSFAIFEKLTLNIPVIFTTAYDQYAIQAFQVNSISYLLKPIRKRDLEAALKKYQTLHRAQNINMDKLIAALQAKEPEYRSRFLIRIGERMKKIHVEQVAYFYAMEKSVFLKTFENNDYPIDLTLDKLAQELEPLHFFRINRKYIVNMEAIQSMVAWSKSRVKLHLAPPPDDDQDVVVSSERAGDFKKWLDK